MYSLLQLVRALRAAQAPQLEPLSGKEAEQWLSNPAWGNSYAGLVPSVENTVLGIAALDRSYGPPSVHTVNLWRSAPSYANVANYDFKARITWGVGSQSRSFMCDWRNGAQVSLVCSSLQVDAVTERAEAGTAYNSGNESVVLAAAFARGNAPSRALRYSRPMQILGAAGTFPAESPAYAENWMLLGGSATNPLYVADTRVTVSGPAGTIAYAVYVGTQLGPHDADAIPFANGQERLSVFNNAAGNIFFKLVYRLSL